MAHYRVLLTDDRFNADYELERTGGVVVEQVIRPTGLVDPGIKVYPTRNQVDTLVSELRKRVEVGERALVTTLTKRMAEALSQHLAEQDFKVQYLHSDVETVERIRELIKGGKKPDRLMETPVFEYA